MTGVTLLHAMGGREIGMETADMSTLRFIQTPGTVRCSITYMVDQNTGFVGTLNIVVVGTQYCDFIQGPLIRPQSMMLR